MRRRTLLRFCLKRLMVSYVVSSWWAPVEIRFWAVATTLVSRFTPPADTEDV